eukprot:scaffold104804_cov57-Attheya_sp.AAC.1
MYYYVIQILDDGHAGVITVTKIWILQGHDQSLHVGLSRGAKHVCALCLSPTIFRLDPVTSVSSGPALPEVPDSRGVSGELLSAGGGWPPGCSGGSCRDRGVVW